MAKAISSADSAFRLDPIPSTATLISPLVRGAMISVLRLGAAA